MRLDRFEEDQNRREEDREKEMKSIRADFVRANSISANFLLLVALGRYLDFSPVDFSAERWRREKTNQVKITDDSKRLSAIAQARLSWIFP